MSLLQDSWAASELEVIGCHVWLLLVKPSVVTCSVVWGLPREGDVLDCGAWDHFAAAAAAVNRFSHQVLCICVPNQVE